MKRKIIAITEYIVLAAILLALAASAGCGETGPGDTVEEFLKAALNKDCAAMVELSSEETLGSQSREEAVRECEESGALTSIFSSFEAIELKDFETLEEDIRRDEATVKARITMKVGDREEVFEESFLVVLEGEDWKIKL